MEKVASWERKFQVWQYSVSHSLLLIRSFHPQRYETRIDFLFNSVEIMHVQPTYQTFRVDLASTQEAQVTLGDRFTEFSNVPLYVINDGEGYVCARRASWHEDAGDHHTPSAFGPLRGTP